MLSSAEIVRSTGYRLQQSSYFPGDLRAIGDWFPHHELQTLYVRESG